MRKKTVISDEVAARCVRLVHETAKAHGIAPVLITAHVRSKAAVRARHHVWRVMIHEMHLPRGSVAMMFERDLRRLRKSVLGF